jgi:hypothetical protein
MLAMRGSRLTLAVTENGEALSEALSDGFLRELARDSLYVTLRVPAESAGSAPYLKGMSWVDMTGGRHSPSPGFVVVYLPSARDLIRLSEIISSAAFTGTRSFLVINPLNSLLDANGQDEAAKFVEFLASNLRHAGMGGLFLLHAKDAKAREFSARIAPLFDSVQGC